MKYIKILIKLILCFSPRWLKHRLFKLKERKELQVAFARSRRTRVGKDEVLNIINGLNIGHCDVLLHTSVSNIGRVGGGVKWVAQCLMQKVDITTNTLLVSALPFRGRFKDYLDDNPVFDVRTAPVAMGAVNEYIAKLSEAERSLHPTHSIVSIGKNAYGYVAEHHLDITPFGVHSPYYKLIKNRGKIVLFGAKLDNSTSIHVVEDLLGDFYPVKVYCKKIYEIKCVDRDGTPLTVATKCHDTFHSAFRNSDCLYDGLVAQGIMEVVKIGESHVLVIDAYAYAIYYLRQIAVGNTIYGHRRVSDETRTMIDKIIETL